MTTATLSRTSITTVRITTRITKALYPARSADFAIDLLRDFEELLKANLYELDRLSDSSVINADMAWAHEEGESALSAQ